MRPDDRFQHAWRTWLEKPTRLTGASAVRAARSSALRAGRRRRIGGVLVFSITLVAGGLWLQRTAGVPERDEPPASTPSLSAESTAFAVGQDVVIMPLDQRTRLYLILPRRQ